MMPTTTNEINAGDGHDHTVTHVGTLAIQLFSTCLGKVAKRIEELFVVGHLQQIGEQLIWLRI
jgi:hypothetical protein